MKSSIKNENKHSLPLDRKNYILMLVSIGIAIIGFILMSDGKSASPDVFNEEMFSFRRITLSVIFVLAGFSFMIYAIMYRPKDKNENDKAA